MNSGDARPKLDELLKAFGISARRPLKILREGV